MTIDISVINNNITHRYCLCLTNQANWSLQLLLHGYFVYRIPAEKINIRFLITSILLTRRRRINFHIAKALCGRVKVFFYPLNWSLIEPFDASPWLRRRVVYTYRPILNTSPRTEQMQNVLKKTERNNKRITGRKWSVGERWTVEKVFAVGRDTTSNYIWTRFPSTCLEGSST